MTGKIGRFEAEEEALIIELLCMMKINESGGISEV